MNEKDDYLAAVSSSHKYLFVSVAKATGPTDYRDGADTPLRGP